MADSAETDTPTNLYEPKSTLTYASRVGLQAAVVGTFVSTIQNALSSHSRGAMGFLTRTGGTIGFFGVCHILFARKMPIYILNLNEQVLWDSLSRSPSLSLPTNGRKTILLMERLVPVRQVSSLAFVVRL